MRTRPAAVSLALAALACAGAHAASTLIYCAEGSPEGFDPARYTAGTTFDASSQPVFNRLVEFERGGTNIVPALAERWSISPDGLVYTFSLRKGVKFHSSDSFKPTRELNANDVIFTLERMINKEHAFNKAAPASFEYAQDMGLHDNVAKIDRPDAMTVRITLKSVDTTFLANLADNLIFAITKDSAVRLQKLKAGECNVSSYPKPAEVEVLKKRHQHQAAVAKRFEHWLPVAQRQALWALPVQRAYNPNGQQAAELVQADLAKIGIKAQIVKYEWAEYLKRAKAGESDIGMFGWTGDNGDPDNFLVTLLSCSAVGGSNYAQWCNKEYDELVNRAKRTSARPWRATK